MNHEQPLFCYLKLEISDIILALIDDDLRDLPAAI